MPLRGDTDEGTDFRKFCKLLDRNQHLSTAKAVIQASRQANSVKPLRAT
jgi:hypothetical protein